MLDIVARCMAVPGESEPVSPSSYRLVADIDTSLVEQVFDLS